MNIRLATQSDIPALAKLYADAVNAIAPKKYSPEQVKVWAAFPLETESFKSFILAPKTFIAEDGEKICGFSGLESDGHIVSVYVRPDYFRQGVGSQLLVTVLEEARRQNMSHLYSEASEFSQPLFEKFGFQNYEMERVFRNGVCFDRYLMRRI